MPKISIILPTYNGEKYISEAIDSILSQTFNDWELIVVNDCSMDNTLKIVNQYAEKDSRIMVVNNCKNQKLPKSLNIGFAKAKGEYLTWTSDDNYYLSNALCEMVDYLEKHDDIMVVGSTYYINDCGKIVGSKQKYTDKDLFRHNCVGACFMYHREVLTTVGEYDEKMFLVEDYEYWLRILLRYGKIGYIDKELYCYRLHEDSLTVEKANDVKQQLMTMRAKYIEQIVKNLEQDKSALCAIYYDFLEANFNMSCFKELFQKKVPELINEVPFDVGKTAMIYGAGNYGDKAYEKVGNIVKGYLDKSSQKIGRKKNGLNIYGIDYLLEKKECQILIAVNKTLIYSCICELKRVGIEKFSVYQSL